MTKFFIIALLLSGLSSEAQINTNPSSGNVGIGTSEGNGKFQVNSGNTGSGTVNWIAGNFGGIVGGRVVMGLLYGIPTIGSHNYALTAWNNLAINPDGGNVGIGTSYPTSKLSVNGNIRAKEVKVETANWPDFVFHKQYILPTLVETENFIKNNGHLPNIPSADDIAKNGQNLGDMNAKLLRKVEELTLYMIELQKKNEVQQQQINVLNNKMNALQQNHR